MEYRSLYLNSLNGVKRRLQRRKFASKRRDIQPKTSAAPSRQINSRTLGLCALVIILVVVVIGGYLVVRFLSFHPQKFSANEPTPPTVIAGAPYTVMFVVYNQYDTYQFVDTIALVTFGSNGEQNRLTVINPDISSELTIDDQTKLRSLINFAELQGRDPMSSLQAAIEDMLALPVDRYVAIEKDNLQTMLTNLGVNYLTDEALSDSDAGNFKAGEVISGSKLISYLAADAPGWDDKNARIEDFIKDRLNTLNFSVFLKLLLTDNLQNYFYTNLSSSEIFNLALQVNANPTLSVVDLPSSVFVQVKSTNSTIIVPATTAVDTLLKVGYQRADVLREQVRVEIYNATNTSGLANQTKRMLENQGANVIRAGNYPDVQDKNKLYVKDLDKTKYNVLLIKQLLRDNVTIINTDYPFNHTGEVVLVLGGDPQN